MSPAYSLPVRFSETLPSLLPHHSLLSLSCCFQRVGVHLSPRSSSGGSRCSPGTALGGRHSPLAWSRGGTLPNHGRSTISHPHPPTPSSHVSCSFGCPYVLWAFKLACPQSGCRGTLCKAGLYNKTIRRVLDIDLWYLMATEYLECGRCKKKVAGWSRDLAERPAD